MPLTWLNVLSVAFGSFKEYGYSVNMEFRGAIQSSRSLAMTAVLGHCASGRLRRRLLASVFGNVPSSPQKKS